jgi:hypothetical protein
MDDYNVNVLSEAKNEYSSRLVTILTPLMIEGTKSIFEEACKLCNDNDEGEKYLMTFQNFLSRVPKWNSTIIEDETKRIITLSQCNYLDDLLTCVHITQLKILTSIRVSQKQKKIDIDIPKLSDFIHKCYIQYARKLYSNVYLFEKNILPLSHQKNMREAELICQESILQVVRDGMPVEKILRAYMDETVDEEIIEETVEKMVDETEKIELEQKTKRDSEATTTDQEQVNTLKKPVLEKLGDTVATAETVTTETSKENFDNNETTETNDKTANINLVIETPITDNTSNDVNKTVEMKSNISKVENTVLETKPKKQELTPNDMDKAIKTLIPASIKFNDNDSVLDLGTNKSSEVNAPKTIERLEKISHDANEKRKLEEAEEDDDYDDEKLVIHDASPITLDKLDVHDLDKKISTKPDPILDEIEILT